MENKLCVFCVDDEMSIRDLYSCAYESVGIDCECFEDGKSLFARLEEKSCDIIMLDVMLDGLDGFEILSILKSGEKHADIPCVMVSAKGDEVSKVKGLNMGADDYIEKPFGIMELVARTKANARKRSSSKKKELSAGGIRIDSDVHKVYIGGESVTFTLKEYNLLKLLVGNFSKVILREEILEKVWGTDFFGETRTLDMHIKELRRKLAKANASCEIETVRGVGYILK